MRCPKLPRLTVCNAQLFYHQGSHNTLANTDKSYKVSQIFSIRRIGLEHASDVILRFILCSIKGDFIGFILVYPCQYNDNRRILQYLTFSTINYFISTLQLLLSFIILGIGELMINNLYLTFIGVSGISSTMGRIRRMM